MATNWKKAQENEARFWRSIYVEKRKDVPTYMPITDEKALAFMEKTLDRFGQSPDIIRDSVAIDVGCGPYGLIRGFDVYSKQHACAPKKIYGVDPLMDVYTTFGTLPTEPYIQYITARAESIPLPDHSCDYVYSTNVVDHVEDPEKVLAECKRICSPDGTVCFAVHVVNFPFSLFGPVLFLIDKNHPHHFSTGTIIRMAGRHFRRVVIKRMVSITEDHPEFTFMNAYRTGNIARGLKRWLSTFVLSLCYLQCNS